MAYQIKDETILHELRHLAKVRRKTVADVLREAVRNEAERQSATLTLTERLEPLLAKVRAMKPATGGTMTAEEQKRFVDELWEP